MNEADYTLTHDDLEIGKLYLRLDDPNCVVYKESNTKHWVYRAKNHRTIYISFIDKIKFKEIRIDEAIESGLFPDWGKEETNSSHLYELVSEG